MNLRKTGLSRWRAAAFGAVGAVFVAGSAVSAADTPFGPLQGSWGGTGIVTYKNGEKERLRCRVQYTQRGPNDLSQALRCASDSYKFQINAFYKHAGGTLSGRWSELVMNLNGTITGSLANGRIDGQLHGPGFVAVVQVVTTGSQQTVDIEAPPDQEITHVAIAVTKGGR